MEDQPVPFDPTGDLWKGAPWLNSNHVDPRDGKLRPEAIDAEDAHPPRPRSAFVRSKGLPARTAASGGANAHHIVLPQAELEPVWLADGLENSILCDEMRSMEEDHRMMALELKRAAKERKRLLAVITQLTSLLQERT